MPKTVNLYLYNGGFTMAEKEQILEAMKKPVNR